MPQTASIPVRLPLDIDIETRDYTLTKDARLVNGYSEKMPDGTSTIFKRPGLNWSGLTTAASSWSDVYNWFPSGGATSAAVLVYVNSSSSSTTLYVQSNFPFTVAIPVTSATFEFETLNDANQSLVLYAYNVAGTAALFSYNQSGGLTNDSAAFNANLGAAFALPGVVYLDGTVYIMDSFSNIWGSNINSIATWQALNKLQSASQAEVPIRLAKHLVYVVAMKSFSIEFFYDAGNATGSPLSGVPGMKLDFGCASANTVQNIVGNLVWVARGRGTSYFVVMLENGRPSRISTPAIERILARTLTTFRSSFQLSFAGHNLYGINITLTSPTNASTLTLVFDLKEKKWYNWTGFGGASFSMHGGQAVNVGSTINDYDAPQVLASELTGQLFNFDPNVYSDVASTGVKTGITVDIYTKSFDGGTRRKKELGEMFFDGDKNSTSLQVRHNDRDYDTASWSNFRSVDMSLDQVKLSANGSFYRRAWNLRHKADTPFRLEAVELEANLGTL